jgi:hypothetical protein
MKKKLDTSGVFSELSGQSAFFKRADNPPSAPQQEIPQSERTEIRPENRSEMRSVRIPIKHKRLTRRYSFEFYDDQITQVKGIKHDLDMAGERVSMSDIVRDALDEYLNKIDNQNRTDNRSEIRTNENANG